MRVKTLLTTALVLTAAVTAQADSMFTTQFNSGRIPAIMSCSAGEDAPQVDAACYRLGVPTENKGWTVIMATPESSYAAVCATHTGTDRPMQSVLSCPQVTVSGTRPMLRWKAKSIYPAFPESYQVTLLEEGKTEPTILYSTDNAPAEWRDYAIDLYEWIGKNITISFTCTSVNKYMLAIDDIFVGEPEEELYSCVLWHPLYQYVGAYAETASVRGSVTNLGMKQTNPELVLRYGDEEMVCYLASEWGPSLTFTFDFPVPVALGQTIDYTLGIKNEAGDFTLLKEGKIVCSHYPRRLLVDEFTGMWCNDCPKGQIEVEKLKQQFGSQLIDIVPHINDMFECTDYRNGYQVYAVPYLVLNRNPATAGQTTRSFSQVYEDPTVSMIEIIGYTIDGNRLDVKTRVYWAEDLDNSDDRYRVAYTLTRNVYTDEDISAIYQKNGAQGLSYGRFNVLPTKIPSYLTHLDNIPLTGLFSHTGLPYSLPASMLAGGYYDSEFSMEKPAMSEEVEWPSIKDYDLKDCRLVAYIVDSTNGHVLNAVEQYLDEPAPEPVSAISPEIDNASDIDAEPEYYNLQGLKVINPAAGIYIERRGSKVSKVVVR